MRLQNKFTSIAALLLVTPLLLTGCANEGGPKSDKGAVVEQGSDTPQKKSDDTPKKSDDTSKSEKNDKPDVKIETNGDLPEGFPKDAIVPKGEISFSGKADSGFSVIMIAEDSDIDAAIEAMKSKGWKEKLNMGTAEGRIVSLENSDWSVGMIVGKDEESGKMSIIYTVTPM